jgi:hypothetical protein
MHDLELLAFVYALRVWRHYLIGLKILVKDISLWIATHIYIE